MDDEGSYEDDYEYEYSDEDDEGASNAQSDTDSADISMEWPNGGNDQDSPQIGSGNNNHKRPSNFEKSPGRRRDPSGRKPDNPNAAPVQINPVQQATGGGGEFLEDFKILFL